jgi:hypothetical protein
MKAATEQRDSISEPDLAALEDEARMIETHPDFDRALGAFCDGLISFHSGRRLANLGLGYTLGWAVATLVLYLDHASPEGTTSAKLIELCTAGGLAGAKAVKGAVRVLLSFGLLAEETRPDDRRAKRLRPTELLFDIQTDNIVARMAALEILRPLPGPAREWGRRREVLLAFCRGNVEAFARHRFKLYDGFPEVRAFMDRACGYLVLLYILNSVGPTSAAATPATVSLSAIAARFDVSRAHVRKLLAAARDQGWLKGGSKRDQIFLEPSFHRRLRHWIALEFVWAWRLVGPNHEAPVPAGASCAGAIVD